MIDAATYGAPSAPVGGASSVPVTPPVAATSPMPTPSAPAVSAETPVPAPGLNTNVSSEAVLPMPAPVAEVPVATPAVPVPPVATLPPVSETPTSAPVAAPSAAPATPADASKAVTAEAMVPPPPVEALKETPAPAVDANVNERLGALESQLQTLATEITANKSTGGTDPAVAQALQNLTAKLDQITAQVDTIEQRVASSSNAEMSSSMPQEAAPVIDKVIDVQQEETPVKPKPVVKRAPVIKHAAAKKPTAPKTAAAWELRSAQPGVAWIGRKGTDEMARYAVGDSVPGLGTVQSVTPNPDGSWIAHTSGGSVK